MSNDINNLRKLVETDMDLTALRDFLKTLGKELNDTIQVCLVPGTSLQHGLKSLKYNNEAEMLNKIVFGCSSKKWKAQHPELAAAKSTMRGQATRLQLYLLCVLMKEDIKLIREGVPMLERKELLGILAQEQTEFYK